MHVHIASFAYSNKFSVKCYSIITRSSPSDVDEDEDDCETVDQINRMLSLKNSGVDKYGDLKYEKLTAPRTVDLDLTRSA